MAKKTTYLALLRGINVGGKNKLPMAQLRTALEELGLEDVSTWIQSGNVIFRSPLDPATLAQQIETALTAGFTLDSELIRVLVISHADLRAIVDRRPTGFGDEPGKYHSDAIFLMGIPRDAALAVFAPREGVDSLWPGPDLIYHQRLSAELTKSRLSRIVGTPAYQSMTIRSWSTTLKLLDLMDAAAAG